MTSSLKKSLDKKIVPINLHKEWNIGPISNILHREPVRNDVVKPKSCVVLTKEELAALIYCLDRVVGDLGC